MAEVEDQPSTDLLALLPQVQAYAAAHALSAVEVTAQLRALLSNNAPLDVADVDGPPAAPAPQAPPDRSSWLMMSPAKRAELREKNRNIVAEAAAVPYAEQLAFWKKKRGELAAAVAEAQLPEILATMLVDLMMSAAAWLGGSPPMKAEVMALRALLRVADAPGSVVREHRLLDHLYSLANALDAAAAGRPGALHKLLPPSRERDADRPPPTAAALLKGLVGAAMVGMTHGGVVLGAVQTQASAEAKVRAAFAREGIDLASGRPQKDMQACNRLERDAARNQPLCKGDQTAARDTLTIFQGTVRRIRQRVVGGWPLTAREVWLATVAAEARRHAS